MRTVGIVVAASVMNAVLSTSELPSAADYGRPVQIGVLTDGWGPTWEVVGLRDGLEELGYQENRDFMIGVRFTQGNTAALPGAARDLLDYGANILFTGGRSTTQAAYSATQKIPIVFAGGGDPVGLGLIESYAHPGGNVTGVTALELELAPKRLESFKQIFPPLNRVLFPYNVRDPYGVKEAAAHRRAARNLGITLLERPAQSEEEVEAILARLEPGDVDGIMSTRPISLNIPDAVLQAGTRDRLPTMFASPFFVENGGLASYSPHSYESGRMAARLVAKVIECQSPSTIPVETNQKIELLINLKAANNLGIEIPPKVLFKANRVIR